MEAGTIKTTLIDSGTYSLGQWSLSSADSGETWRPLNGPGSVVLDGHGSGSVSASGVSNLTVEGLTFQNMGLSPQGSGGFYLSGSGETIRWNTFLNSQHEVIYGAALHNSLIDSNTIDGVTGANSGAFDAMQFWFGSSGNTISHNLIQNVDGGGIDFDNGATDPQINNNVIDSNKLVNVNRNTVDSGAIYIMDRTHSSTGNKITNNVIDGYGSGSMSDQTKGIYLDDGTSNVQITGNLLYGTAGEWGMQFHGGSNDVVQNNVFALQSGEKLALYQSVSGGTSMTGNDFQNNIVYYQGQPPDPLWQVSGSGITMPRDTTNLYYAANGAQVPNDGSITDSNPFRADPQFTNPGGGDFSLSASSPAYSDIGWQTLPTNQGPVPFSG